MRRETDTMGEVLIPAGALYGAQYGARTLKGGPYSGYPQGVPLRILQFHGNDWA